MKWYQVIIQMMVADPVGFAAKIVRLAMLAFGAVSIVLAHVGITFTPAEAEVQEIVGIAITFIMLVWSFKNDADLKQSAPVKQG